jgi:hypothetical protein
MKKLLAVAALAVGLVGCGSRSVVVDKAPVKALNFAWGEYSDHADCFPCGDNVQYVPQGNPPQMVPVAWDKHLYYNGVQGTLDCPPGCSNPL